ncbi:hypothetical protein ACMFMG_004750 [Clarireedia jacksonii]
MSQMKPMKPSLTLRSLVLSPRWAGQKQARSCDTSIMKSSATIPRFSGSPFFPSSLHKGAIFFFEVSQGENSSPMPLARIRSDLVDLVNTGLWDDIVGLVVGRTFLYDEKMNKDLEMMIEELVDGGPNGGHKWPVLFGVDVPSIRCGIGKSE